MIRNAKTFCETKDRDKPLHRLPNVGVSENRDDSAIRHGPVVQHGKPQYFRAAQRRIKPPPAGSGWFVRNTSPAVGLNA
jgi:hypothetical protein